MVRDRDWRRAQDERKLLRILHQRRFTAYTTSSWGYIFNNILKGRYKTYTRRLADGDRVELTIKTYEDYLAYQRFYARKYRDNPKECGCDLCCNPRFSGISRGWQKLTMQERRFLFQYHEQLNEI